jgi:hypothetical protein
MPNFTEDCWSVATFLRPPGNHPITIRLSRKDLAQCGSELQMAIMDATLLPPSEILSLRSS